jgi:hypothetical protein
MTADDRDGAESTAFDPRNAEDRPGAPPDRCWSCGAALPDGAMFCGECGSAVGARAARPAEPADSEPEDAEAQPVADPNDSGLPPHGDALLETPVEVPEGDDPQRVSDQDDPQPSADQDESGLPPHGDALLDPDAASAWSPAGSRGSDPVGSDPDRPEPDSTPTDVQPVLHDGDVAPPHGDPGASGMSSIGFATEAAEPAFDDSADPLAPLTPEERFAAERLLDPDSGADKFVLQFSTGESATVYGSGLVGRNPVAEPGEYVDHLVVLRDPGRSVSKTHLEFGQDGGAFWVLDRFSGNGSVLREPDGAPKRCEPGRRYFVARGTRIEIGDQFFVVS